LLCLVSSLGRQPVKMESLKLIDYTDHPYLPADLALPIIQYIQCEQITSAGPVITYNKSRFHIFVHSNKRKIKEAQTLEVLDSFRMYRGKSGKNEYNFLKGLFIHSANYTYQRVFHFRSQSQINWEDNQLKLSQFSPR
jgi:hypothetical protein